MTGVESEEGAPLAVNCVGLAPSAMVCEEAMRFVEATPSTEVCMEMSISILHYDEAAPFIDEGVALFAAVLCVDPVEVDNIDVDEFAESSGLSQQPRLPSHQQTLYVLAP